MMKARNVLVFVCAVALAVAAGADQQVNERRAAAANGLVTVETISGTITVTGWSSNEVTVEGTLGRGIERLDLMTSGDRTRIKVIYPDHCRDCGGAELEIMVPMGSRLEVDTVSADVSVDQVTGQLDIETVSGNATLRGRPAEVDAESVSGDLDLATGGAPVEASSVSGKVLVREAGERVRASTVSGTVQVEAEILTRGEFESVSGDVRISSAVSSSGRVTAETVSGTVELTLPASTAADFEVETFSGDIDNELGPRAQRTGRYTPEKELQFSTGGGGARITVKSFSGSIRLRSK